MKLIIRNLFFVGLWLLAAHAFGQVTTTLTPATVTAAVGSPVVLDFKVSGFQNIITMQVPLRYDTTLLRYDSVSMLNLPDLNAGNINRRNDRVNVSWNPDFQRFPNGVSVADGTTLMKFHFTVRANGTTNVNFANNITNFPILFIRSPNLRQTVTTNGSIITAGTGGGGNNGGGGGGGGGVTGTAVIVGNVAARSGDVVCAPVTVNDFNKIVGMNWVLNWDPAVLTFRNTQAFNLAGLDCNKFNANTAGRLVVSWVDPDPNALGITLVNGTRIFDVCFTAAGANGTSTALTPNGVGLPQSIRLNIENDRGQNLWTTTSGVAGRAEISASAPVQPPAVTAGLAADRDTVPVGERTCVDIKVTRFTNITAFQFGLSYDPALIEFASAQGGPLNLTTATGPTDTMANIRVVQPGQIRVNWAKALRAPAVTYADNSTLLSVCFRGIGTPGATSPINFITLPTPNTGIRVDERDCNLRPLIRAGSVLLAAAPNGAASATAAVTPVSCFGGNNGAVNLNIVGGLAPYTFNWNGPGITNANRTIEDPTGLTPGTYTVTVTTSNAITSTATAVITQPAAALTLTANQITPTNVGCNGPNTGRITVGTPSGGTSPFTFNWAGPGIASGNQTLQSPNNLSAGTYTVTVTDTRNCTITATAVVGAATAISAAATPSNVRCFGQSTGSIALSNPAGGATPYTYRWRATGGATDVSTQASPTNLAAGSYNVTITDANNCTFTLAQAVTITAPPAALTANPQAATGNCTGATINLNPSGGWPGTYTAVWSGNVPSTTTTATGLSTGSYSATITDAGGCTLVTQPLSVTATAVSITAPNPTVTNATCFGRNNGAITIVPQGGRAPYSVSWHNTMTGTTINGLVAGPYFAVITDADQCSSSRIEVVVGQPTQITVPDANRTVRNVTCFGAGDGSISITPTGGAGTYQINWGSLAGQNIFQLNPGAYTATITDAAGCSTTLAPITITAPEALTIAKTVTLVGATTPGGITLTPGGGTQPYKYDWADLTGTDDPKDRTGLTRADTFRVTVTDANGCRVSEVIIVENDNPLRNARVLSSQGACNRNGSVRLEIPSIARAPYVISWTGDSRSTSENQVTITPLPAGLYTFTITDANNRNITLPAVTISELAPALVADQTTQPTENLRNGAITLTPNPANADLTYLWSNGLTTAALTTLDSGRYVVTVTNRTSGCTATYSFSLARQYEAMSARMDTIRPDCRDARNGRLEVRAAGGDRTYTYNWAGPAGFTSTTAAIENLVAGAYTVTITDGRGVSITRGPIEISSRSALAITGVTIASNYNGFQVSGSDMCNGIGIVAFTGQGGTLPVDIKWSNNITSAENRTLCAGAYSVTLTDQFGCTAVNSGQLTAPAAISLSLDNNSGRATCFSRCDALAQARIGGGVAPYRVRWSIDPTDRPADVLNSTAQSSDRGSLCAGSYVVTVTDGNAVTRTFTVAVTQPERLELEFTPIEPNTFTRCDGELQVRIKGGASGTNYLYTWNTVRANGPRGSGQRAENLCGGDVVQFVVTDQNNCRVSATDTIPYPADGCLEVSPVLTPGEQDGINDFMIIACIEAEPRNTVEVYNRWGQLVYQTTGYDNASKRWGGTTNRGSALPEGIYYYVITLTKDNGDPVEKRGFVNLLR